MPTAEQIIAALNLAPHPEGGWYRQTWAASPGHSPNGHSPDDRPSGTCIYFLLKSGQASHWHRVDAAEIWLYHTGAPLILSRAATDKGPAHEATLGPDILAGQSPQLIVAPNHWQAARTTGDWTLVSCTVSPGFQFETFELAPKGFDISL